MYPVLETEVGSILDDNYSVTRVATTVAWYLPCMICIRSGDMGRSVGGVKIYVAGWVCGRGFYIYIFVKGMLLGYFMGFYGAGEWV